MAVTNSGSEMLTITGVSFSGANSDEFSSSFTGSVDVAGGASVNIPVVFAPTSEGAKSAQLEVAFNGAGSPSKTTLTGEGLVVSPGDVLYRVNAGGRSLASLNGFRIWTEDQAEVAENALALAQVGSPSPYVNVAMSGNNTFGTLDTITLDASVPSAVPPEIFQTERWDQVGDPNQIWSFRSKWVRK